ncbi:hypothetical protein YPPY47_1179 [Yersinia pestis PY-47]|nr:hypothetical protein YPPY02_1058 [Yersinia pestis PY-02]EIS09335.1 hypothetical protein YPPY47_1179 [Yersinia pestis PY-47]EIT00717.1 hypothetical protein YPPY89_1209 [Yersinia pestis PY-89]EIT44225.1 hypothetical protein YPPY99_1220 [Yersinia pestis PY-99]EIT59202.1 hypothetical protein YPPY102_1102 [Yersinia pestis PY-102]EIT61517.1 hypothetical protein YPPY103_1186 [Yersinia pestis PY-103]
MCPFSGKYSFYHDFGLFWLKRFSYGLLSDLMRSHRENPASIMAEL